MWGCGRQRRAAPASHLLTRRASSPFAWKGHWRKDGISAVSAAPENRPQQVGFPGIARAGRVLTAPNLSTVRGPGTKLDQNLVEKWAGFSQAAELEGRLGKPVRILNDADMHGLAVISGQGLEFVLTLGTGLGAALFMNGDLAPHIELALLPFQDGETYQDRLGNAARRKIGNKAWSKRVQQAVDTFDVLLQFDRLFVGGGNAKKLTVDLGHRVQLVDNKAGILGGLRVWEIDVI
jgi:polyphosphate glucokinase